MARLGGWLTGLALALCLGCGESEPQAPAQQPPVLPTHVARPFTGDLPAMRERHLVRALVSYSKTDFFLAGGRPHGLQAELLRRLEKFLNRGGSQSQPRVRVAYVPVRFEELLPALLEGRGDLAAAFLTPTPEREKRLAFASGHGLLVNEVVVTRAGLDHIASLEDLAGRRVYVMRGSSYAEHLREVDHKLRARGLLPIEIVEADPRFVTEDILEMVNAGSVDMTVADDFRARLWAQVLPEIAVREDLAVHEGGHVGWAVRPDNPELQAALEEYLRGVDRGSLVGNVLFQRYYEDTSWAKDPTSEAERQKLARYAGLFRKYGERYGFDWRALAAQAYQESGLDHGRRSRAGAVGLMQLLPRTAADPVVGIPDVSDVDANVHAGAKYLAFLRDHYFSSPEIGDDDRLAFAWAAYNAGPATLARVRARTEAMKLDPDRWFGNAEHAALALVGREPVRYVANIYKYYVAYRLMSDLRGDVWLATGVRRDR